MPIVFVNRLDISIQMKHANNVMDSILNVNEMWDEIYRKRQERAKGLVDRYALHMHRYPQYLQTVNETHPNEQGEYPDKGYDRTK